MFRILQLGDLHFTGKTDNVRKILIQHFESKYKDKCIDAIIFLGDYFYYNVIQEKCNEKILENIHNFIKEVKEKTKCEEIYLVAGNHDFDNSKLPDGHEKEKYELNDIPHNYIRREKDNIENAYECFEKLKVKTGAKNIGFLSSSHMINSRNEIFLNIFNSSWLCGNTNQKNNNKENINTFKRLWLNDGETGYKLRKNTKSSFIISAFHHPYNHLSEYERYPINGKGGLYSQIIQRSDLVLNGHIHKQITMGMFSKNMFHEKLLINGVVKEDVEDYEEISYNEIIINDDNQLEKIRFCYDSVSEKFITNKGNKKGIVASTDDGKIGISLHDAIKKIKDSFDIYHKESINSSEKQCTLKIDNYDYPIKLFIYKNGKNNTWYSLNWLLKYSHKFNINNLSISYKDIPIPLIQHLIINNKTNIKTFTFFDEKILTFESKELTEDEIFQTQIDYLYEFAEILDVSLLFLTVNKKPNKLYLIGSKESYERFGKLITKL